MTRETLGTLHVGVAHACRDVNPAVDDAYDLFSEARAPVVGELGDLAGDGGHDAAGNAVLDAPLDEPFEGREVDAVVLRPRRMDGELYTVLPIRVDIDTIMWYNSTHIDMGELTWQAKTIARD